MTKFLRQLGLAAKIWLVAVGVNALFIAIDFAFSGGLSVIPQILLMMVIAGGLFSIPCLVVVFCIIRLLATRVKGKWLFGCVMAGGIIITVIVLNAFVEELLGTGDRDLQRNIWVISIMAAIAGVASFYRSIIQWGREFYTPGKI